MSKPKDDDNAAPLPPLDSLLLAVEHIQAEQLYGSEEDDLEKALSFIWDAIHALRDAGSTQVASTHAGVVVDGSDCALLWALVEGHCKRLRGRKPRNPGQQALNDKALARATALRDKLDTGATLPGLTKPRELA